MKHNHNYARRSATPAERKLMNLIANHTDFVLVKKLTKKESNKLIAAVLAYAGLCAATGIMALLNKKVSTEISEMEIPSIFPATQPVFPTAPKTSDVFERCRKVPNVGTFESNISATDMISLIEAVGREYDRNERVCKKSGQYVSVVINGDLVYVYSDMAHIAVDYSGVGHAQLWSDNAPAYPIVKKFFDDFYKNVAEHD